MLRHTVMEWTREWERSGRVQGLQEGLEQGRREGEVKLLLRQLKLKFGDVRPTDQARIEAADSEQLLQWGDRILTARALDEVFES